MAHTTHRNWKRSGNQTLQAALEHLPHRHEFPFLIAESSNAVVVLDPGNRVIYVNPGAVRLFGYAPADILGRPLSILFGGDDGRSFDKLRDSLSRRSPFAAEDIVHGREGRRHWASITANPVFNPDGDHVVSVCVFTDITDTKMRDVLQNRAIDAMARNAPSSEVLELICNDVEAIIPESIVAINGLDENGRLFFVAGPSLPDACRRAVRGAAGGDPHSPSWTAISRGEEVFVEDLRVDPEVAGRMAAFIELGVKGCRALPISGPDGQRFGAVTFYRFDCAPPDEFQNSLSRVLTNLCGLALEQWRVRKEMRRIAFYDPVTGLANRSLLLANGEKTLLDSRAARQDVPAAVLCLNIDHFRRINASLGYEAGNELLSIIAARISERRFPGDIAGRIGADEFAMLLPGYDETRAAIEAERLIADASAACVIKGEEILPSARIGIALYPDNAFTMEDLLEKAGAALSLAKSEGGSRFKFFSEEANSRARRRLALETRLRGAARNNELRLFYQPQVSFDTGMLHGVEALARWENEEFGSVPPESFIPLAEAAGMIDGISDWVVAEVCRQMGEWRRRGVRVPSVAINLSAPNFRDGDLVVRIRDHLRENDLKVSDIVLEITETVFLDDNPEALKTLRKLQDMGIRLSLDDFGSGYSGLSYLRNVPINEIKLDRSFVRDLASNPASRSLSQAIMRLGENLGLRVVVEGVETAEQFALLKKQGFHILQGYFISHPLSPSALEEWLSQHSIEAGN